MRFDISSQTALAAEGEKALRHFGVKGMKWGVRNRDPDASPRSSKELVKEAKTNAKEALAPSMDRRLDRMFGADKIKYSELSTQSRTIEKGAEFYRVTKVKNEPMRDMTYVSTNQMDRLRYQGVLASPRSLRMAKPEYSATYEHTYKTTKKLSLPSDKERVDAFIDLLDAKDIEVRGIFGMKKISGRQYLVNTGYPKEVKKLEAQKVGEEYYNRFITEQWRQTPINTAYFNNIKSRGYNALSDDNDRRIVSDDPLMLLGPSSMLRTSSVRRLTNDEINTALASIKPLED